MNVARNILYCLLMILGWTLVTPAVGPVFAQEAQEEREEVMLEPVKVTAHKREENVQEVPASVDVFDGKELQDAGIKEMEDLIFHTPNVYRSGSFVEHGFVIRGVKKFMSSPDANVVMYVDDVPLPLHYTHNVEMLDIERIEVLRGPRAPCTA